MLECEKCLVFNECLNGKCQCDYDKVEKLTKEIRKDPSKINDLIELVK